MVRKEPLIDVSTIDLDNVIADIEEIRKYNKQRFEMEQLTAIVYSDLETHLCVGYKDVAEDEFWARGHMPGLPLMPGVLMLEAAAQLCSYFSCRYDLLGGEILGFGGLEDVRFRDPVRPGSRFVVATKLVKVRRNRMIVGEFEGYINGNVAVEGIIKGIPLPIAALQDYQKSLDK